MIVIYSVHLLISAVNEAGIEAQKIKGYSFRGRTHTQSPVND